MKTGRLIRGTAAIAVAVLALATAAAGSRTAMAGSTTPSVPPAEASTWEMVPIPSVRGQADLTEVTAFSPSDAWAVGYVRDRTGVRTLTLHWDGSLWTRIPSPNRSRAQNWLFAVAGSSSSDVWAAGYDVDADGTHRTLLLHWNGMRWQVVPSPSDNTLDSMLVGVTALSPTDAWAVGSVTAWPFTGQTLVQHWDGDRWSVVESPNPGTTGLGSNLLDVAASSAADLWAVGDYDEGDMVMRTLTEHWDGTSWTVVPSPTRRDGALLGSVAADSATEAWAVGYAYGPTHLELLAQRWDGSSWQVSTTPTFDGMDATFADVALRGPDDVWAVGGQGTDTLIAHWDGLTWTVVPGVDPGTVGSSLTAVTAVPASTCLWAVGQFTDGERAEPFIERSCTP
ncbi:hypothetical protein [Actinopolymorpha sp. B9G3]|uniref:hypothetical protein n=1 Tax=Actinopolymorpha sp. B9G3 TaxID=3158970 RepID=UPI0032D8D76C